MNELKQQLIDKLGIDEAMADTAIQLVFSYAKDKLPENLRGPLDQISKGETPDMGDTAMNALKGFLG
ncbi:hypothetical protein ACFPK9_15305 [Rubritalea spongiae]|uniref:DUF2267 domain-containing protein n=1 Tax=Rubritalea spongiae TaxID=430797 RepID=A0ABW5DZ55_9BACT